MALEPVKVPQNVQIEDRLIGPITLKQIIICLVGGGLSFVTWNIMKQMGMITTFYLVLAWIPFAIAAAFAFIKVQNLTLLRILFLLIERTEKSMIRTWQPRTGIRINVRTYFQTQKNKAEQSSEHVEHDKLKKLSSLLDESAEKYNPDEEQNPNVRPGTPEQADAEPVDPNRIAVDGTPQSAPIDGITPPAFQPSPTPGPRLQDIAPPSTS